MKKKPTKAARDRDRNNILFHLKRLSQLLDNHFENIDILFKVVPKKAIKKKRRPGTLKKHHDLDHLAGTWSAKDQVEIMHDFEGTVGDKLDEKEE